jgi:death-on-curing protein
LNEPIWVPRLVVEAIHLDQVSEHGGMLGLRDEAILESALARPRHKWTYKRKPDLTSLGDGCSVAMGPAHSLDSALLDGVRRQPV